VGAAGHSPSTSLASRREAGAEIVALQQVIALGQP
jgi:hypothetical protein